MNPKLSAHEKPALEALAHSIFRSPPCLDELRARGRLELALRDHPRFSAIEIPSARYFYAHTRDMTSEGHAAMPDTRLRVWAVSSESTSTPFSPLVLRGILDRLGGTLLALLTEPSPDTFVTCIRGGALSEALDVLASLYDVDGVALWQFDETRRQFRSVATVGMGSTGLRVPAGHPDDMPRRGVVSQVMPDRKAVVYDSENRQVWQPATSGEWEPFDQTLFKGRHWRSCLAVPIVYAGRLVGALSVYSLHPAEYLLSLERDLYERAALCGAAILVQRDYATVAELARRYDEELLTANVSLSALSLSHDVMHYYRSVMFSLDQSGAYLETGQVADAAERISTARDTMKRTEPVIAAMRKLATEARTSESGKGPQVTPDFAAVLSEIEPLLRAILPHYTKSQRLKPDRIRLSVQGSVRPVKVAPVALERVIMNLCVNSAQWRASEVTVTAHFERSQEDVHVVVRDDGRGIPARARDRVFDRFYSGRGGSGLGLYVVRSIASRAGGDVFLQSVDHTESIEHRGTAVTVVLPTIPDNSHRG